MQMQMSIQKEQQEKANLNRDFMQMQTDFLKAKELMFKQLQQKDA